MTAIAVLAAPTAKPTPVALHPVADSFDLAILQGALGVLSETDWVQGVDETAQIVQLTNDLTSDVLLIADGLRDDDFIRARATASLRRLSAKYRRDRTAGLATSPAWIDVGPLAAPDLMQSRA